MNDTHMGDQPDLTPQPDQRGTAASTTVYMHITEGGRTPVYATPGSAGCDLYLARDLTLLPGQQQVLPVNISLALEPGVEAQIRPRSGLSLKTTLRIPNSPGTIDCDYRDPVGVIAENTAGLFSMLTDLMRNPQLCAELASQYRQTTYGAYLQEQIEPCQISSWLPEAMASLPVFLDSRGNPYGTLYLKEGDRIAQMVLSRYLRADFILHDNPSAIGHNRGGGFGSTGTGTLS